MEELPVDSTSLLARIFDESPVATKEMVVLPGVLGCRLLHEIFPEATQTTDFNV